MKLKLANCQVEPKIEKETFMGEEQQPQSGGAAAAYLVLSENKAKQPLIWY